MLERHCDMKKQMVFGAPVPHFDEGDIERAAAEQRRFGIERLEIAITVPSSSNSAGTLCIGLTAV
jgi:hypothetical protein